MQGFFTMPGFLGTKAGLYSDLTLVLILISALLFTIGWRLAVGKLYNAHRWVQTSAACLNAAVVLGVMVKSFIINILPGIPAKLFEGSYGVTAAHAFIGGIGLILGVFVDLRGNGLVPKVLRFKNYKLFMRTSYILYMLATIGGIGLYIIVFVFGI